MANELVSAAFRFSVVEQRLFMLLLERIDSRHKLQSNQVIMISAYDFANRYPEVYGNNSNAYRDLSLALDRLFDREAYFKLDANGAPLHQTRFVQEVQDFEGDGYSTGDYGIILADSLYRYISYLRKSFTRVSVDAVAEFRSSYTFRIYEKLAAREKLGVWNVDVRQLKWEVGAESTYQRFSQFREMVIEKAQAEIHAKTDLRFSFNLIRRKRAVVRIEFKIWREGKEGVSEALRSRRIGAHV